jgi:hypothetical protein
LVPFERRKLTHDFLVDVKFSCLRWFGRYRGESIHSELLKRFSHEFFRGRGQNAEIKLMQGMAFIVSSSLSDI